ATAPVRADPGSPGTAPERQPNRQAPAGNRQASHPHRPYQLVDPLELADDGAHADPIKARLVELEDHAAQGSHLGHVLVGKVPDLARGHVGVRVGVEAAEGGAAGQVDLHDVAQVELGEVGGRVDVVVAHVGVEVVQVEQHAGAGPPAQLVEE